MNLYTRMKFCIVASFIEGRLESLLPKKDTKNTKNWAELITRLASHLGYIL